MHLISLFNQNGHCGLSGINLGLWLEVFYVSICFKR